MPPGARWFSTERGQPEPGASPRTVTTTPRVSCNAHPVCEGGHHNHTACTGPTGPEKTTKAARSCEPGAEPPEVRHSERDALVARAAAFERAPPGAAKSQCLGPKNATMPSRTVSWLLDAAGDAPRSKNL